MEARHANVSGMWEETACYIRNKLARHFNNSFLVFFHPRCVLIPDAIKHAAPLAGHTRAPFSIESVCNFELRSGSNWAFDFSGHIGRTRSGQLQ